MSASARSARVRTIGKFRRTRAPPSSSARDQFHARPCVASSHGGCDGHDQLRARPSQQGCARRPYDPDGCAHPDRDLARCLRRPVRCLPGPPAVLFGDRTRGRAGLCLHQLDHRPLARHGRLHPARPRPARPLREPPRSAGPADGGLGDRRSVGSGSASPCPTTARRSSACTPSGRPWSIATTRTSCRS